MIHDHQLMLARRQAAWGMLSLLAGLLLLAAGPVAFWRGFAIQALAWGVIVGASALAGLRRAGVPGRPEDHTRQARRLKQALLASSLLDLFFIAGGLVLAGTLGREGAFAAGSGWGVTLQGVALLLLDLSHALCMPPEPRLPDLDWYPGLRHEAFELPGGEKTVLLLHGLAGTPDEVRPLAEALQAAGWSVRVPLLPGHGAGFGRILQCTAEDWLAAVECEAAVILAEGRPLVLAGFSMGAGLALCTAVKVKPQALVLVAPFWVPESLPVKLAVDALWLLLPPVLPLRWLRRLPEEELREGLRMLLPEMDPGDPLLRTELRKVKVPLAFLNQFRIYWRAVGRAAPRVTCPLLVVQGSADPVAPPARTRRLVSRLGSLPEYVEVPGGHEITRREDPACGQVQEALVEFLEKVASRRP